MLLFLTAGRILVYLAIVVAVLLIIFLLVRLFGNRRVR